MYTTIWMNLGKQNKSSQGDKYRNELSGAVELTEAERFLEVKLLGNAYF